MPDQAFSVSCALLPHWDSDQDAGDSIESTDVPHSLTYLSHFSLIDDSDALYEHPRVDVLDDVSMRMHV